MQLYYGLGDRQAHSRPLDGHSLIASAVELFENHGLLEVVDAWTVIGYAGDELPSAHIGRYMDGRTGRRVFTGVVEELRKDFYYPIQVHFHRGQRVCDHDRYGMVFQSMLGLRYCQIHRLANVVRFKTKFDLTSIQLRHFRSFAHQTVEPVAFFIDHGQQFFSLGRREIDLRQQRLCGGLDGRERSAELVGHRIEQQGTEAVAFAGGFRSG